MDYEKIYDELIPRLKMRSGRARFAPDGASETDGDKIQLPIMSDIYWDMAYGDKDAHLPQIDEFLNRFRNSCYEKLTVEDMCQAFNVNPQSDNVTNTIWHCLSGRALRTFPSLTRDQVMMTMLGSPRYGRLRIIHDVELDTRYKLDVVIVFEDDSACGLGIYVNTPKGSKSYQTHLKRMANNGISHGNLPVIAVALGKQCEFAKQVFGFNEALAEEQNFWFPTVDFVDALVGYIRSLQKPKLSEISAPHKESPREGIQRVLAAQETRWPNVLLRGLRALT